MGGRGGRLRSQEEEDGQVIGGLSMERPIHIHYDHQLQLCGGCSTPDSDEKKKQRRRQSALYPAAPVAEASPYFPSSPLSQITSSIRIAQIRMLCLRNYWSPTFTLGRQGAASASGHPQKFNSVVIKELSNVKEEVYGTLDSFVAWELEFPLIVVKKALKTLEDEREWKRIIQVFADMEELGVRPEGSIIRMLGDVFQKLGMMDKYEKLKKKYPPPKWEYRYIKGKRIRMRVYPDNKTEEATKEGIDTAEREEAESIEFDNEMEEAASAAARRFLLPQFAFDSSLFRLSTKSKGAAKADATSMAGTGHRRLFLLAKTSPSLLHSDGRTVLQEILLHLVLLEEDGDIPELWMHESEQLPTTSQQGSGNLTRAIEFLHLLFSAQSVIREAVLSSVVVRSDMVVRRGDSDGDKAYRRSWGPLTVRYDDNGGEPIILIRESNIWWLGDLGTTFLVWVGCAPLPPFHDNPVSLSLATALSLSILGRPGKRRRRFKHLRRRRYELADEDHAEIQVRACRPNIAKVCRAAALGLVRHFLHGWFAVPPRGSDGAPQRASPRAPLHLKTTACSEANGAHHRPVVDRTSPKLGDRHSPRSPLPEASNSYY
ncbi:hypothetical protein PR202_ga09603 [Eleusine coracana subsp. coracana]|uniref:Pentatricopeptide repeat-containing protein n=1 Tax=Eleusine coracana subsp. coracana TaxID=191504 RepID=A0AAV5C4L7_ELECO|nr:hypothetical protein PR202_ga09603 [Eleusine coracana subsp. coracana]